MLRRNGFLYLRKKLISPREEFVSSSNMGFLSQSELISSCSNSSLKKFGENNLTQFSQFKLPQQNRNKINIQTKRNFASYHENMHDLEVKIIESRLIGEKESTKLIQDISSLISNPPSLLGTSETFQDYYWYKISREILSSKIPFRIHKIIHTFIYDNQLGPVYIPTEETIKNSNINTNFDFSSYEELHEFSRKNPEDFWTFILQKLNIQFDTPPSQIVDNINGTEQAKWLPNSKLNIVNSCLFLESDKIAIISSDVNGNKVTLTYKELKSQVISVSLGLKSLGYKPSDSIAIYSIMNIESVIAYLGIIYAGLSVISIADSFAPNIISQRMKIGKGKGIITIDEIQRGNKMIKLYDKVKEAVRDTDIQAIVIKRNPKTSLRGQDITWDELLNTGLSSSSSFTSEAFVANADATTNILFSSGTTSEPKAIPWTHVTPIKAATDAFLHQNITPNSTLAWPTNLGWMMGPWLIYATFLNQATMALYEDAPNSIKFIEFCKNVRVTMLGVVPSLIKAWRKQSSEVDLSFVHVFSSTGEASSYDDYFWLMAKSNYAPMIEYCGGTEIGGGFITSNVTQCQIPSHFTCKAVGSDFMIVEEIEGLEQAKECEMGELVLVPPMLGSSNFLLNKSHHDTYFNNMPRGPNNETLRNHGDVFERVEISNQTLYRAHGRSDDTMNLGGIKTSSASIEKCCNQVEGVLETAAVGVSFDNGPEQLIIFAVVEKKFDGQVLRKLMQQVINEQESPLFKIMLVKIIPELVRTASGKVMRRILRDEFVKKMKSLEESEDL